VSHATVTIEAHRAASTPEGCLQLVDVHIWDRGYAGSPWVQAAIAANVRFIVRWKQGNRLLDNWGEGRKAWEIAHG
jgi:hypothetical protein